MNAETYIRKHIRSILLEKTDAESEKPKKRKKRSPSKGKIITKVGAVGKGSWGKEIKGAEALAETDANKLMSNLKISGVKPSKNQFETLQQLLEKAVEGTEEMEEVYKILPQGIVKDKDGTEIESVNISVSLISYRNAHKYIEWTIVGATKAFGIKWDTNVILDRAGENISVYLK